MKKIESKLWNVYVCTPEEMGVVQKKKSHHKSREDEELIYFHTTENGKPEYYLDGKYFEENIKEVVTELILSNEFINIDENMTEEQRNWRAAEVSDSLINGVLKNL